MVCPVACVAAMVILPGLSYAMVGEFGFGHLCSTAGCVCLSLFTNSEWCHICNSVLEKDLEIIPVAGCG